jgi:glycosyltransferase involved in cell wall biosynthesis
MPFRIFVPGASALLTDHLPHGEGLLTWNLLAGLAERGHEVVAVTRRAAIASPVPFEVHEIRPVAGLGATGYAIAAARTFHALGGSRRFDVAHWIRPGRSAIAWMPRGVPGVIGPLVPGWPAAPSSTRHPIAAGSARVQDLLLRQLHRSVQRRCVVLLASPAAATERVSGAEAQLLPLGVDTARFSSSPMPPEFTVGYIGNLEQRKGVVDVADAFAQLLETVPTSRLIVAGGGAAEDELRDRLRRTNRAEFFGSYAPEQLGGLLARMTVVALPSRGEPFGMTVLEAMAAGRPVIVADAGTPPFLVGDTGGRVVPAQDPGALAGALREFSTLDSEQLAHAGEAARARADAFSLDRVITQLEALYERMVTDP